MAGLAPEAAHFFKFLFVLVLYSLAMTLFVCSPSYQLHKTDSNFYAEFFTWNILKQWRHCDTLLGVVGTIPNDICRIFCASKLNTPGPSLATVVVSP